MKIINVIKNENNIIVETSKGKFMLQPFSDNTIRIIYTLEEQFSSKQSLMVQKQSSKAVVWNYSDQSSEIIFRTKKCLIKINKLTGNFTYLDGENNILTRDNGKTLSKIDVIKTKFENNSNLKPQQTVDGVRYISDGSPYIDRKAYHCKLEFTWEDDEAIYGLGQHEDGILNYRGHYQQLFQGNMKISIPIIISTKGYGIFFDSCSLMTFHDDQYGSYFWSDVNDEMDYYFIVGPEFDDIIAEIRMLTGKATMLPKWAFGYIQSKEHYKTQTELIDVVSEYRKREIPIDCIVQDWKYWTGECWGQKSFDSDRYPNPKALTQTLHEMNVKLMISIWPNMALGSENHSEMEKEGFLFGDHSTYDAFNESARELYWKQANKGLFSNGIDAWWCDSTEPYTESDWRGEAKMESWERMYVIGAEFKKYIDPQYVNAYSLVHSKGIYDGWRKENNQKRVVNLIRSAYPGQQKYGTIPWSGDIPAKWDVFKKQISDGLNLCVTGLPYWTFDIGAFFTGGVNKWREWCNDNNAGPIWFWEGDFDNGCLDEGYRELYLRWFQCGAFLPVFRSHGTDSPREVWRFGEPGEVIYDTLVNFINLRYRLMPYIYSIAGLTFHKDYTLMRTLAFDFRNDSNVFNINDQYMFGPSLMVCPITSPIYYGPDSVKLADSNKKTRMIYLPKDFDWYNFWTGEHHIGGQFFEADAPLEIIPLFVRAGSIIPMGKTIQHTGENQSESLELRIYKGKNSIFTFYDDEGDNYNYEKGFFATFTITWNEEKQVLSFSDRQGFFKGMSDTMQFNIIIVKESHGIGVTNETQIDFEVTYKGLAIAINI